MLKRIRAFALLLALCALLPLTVHAVDVRWEFDNASGILIGRAPGSVPAFPSFGVKDKKKIVEVYLEDGVTGIGRAAFGECSELRYVRIPSSVKSLGTSCFNFCQNMTAVDLPEGLTEIPAYCFYYCLLLNNVRIPSGVTAIQQEAFYRNRGMNRIFIPASVTEIHSTAFNKCDYLTIYCPEGSYAASFAEEAGVKVEYMTEEQAKTAFPASGYTIDLSSIGTDVAPAPSSSSDSPSSALERELSDGLPLPVFFAAGGALVVIVGVVIFLVIHNKNKKKKYN